MSNQGEPFWLCHECGAQMRPIRRAGVPHCASCDGEFIEILDAEVNPDPIAELPHPPTRPRSSTPSPEPDPNPGSFFQNMFNSLLGAAAEESSSGGSHGNSPHRSQTPGQGQGSAQGRSGGSREYAFNLPGGGRGSVTFGSFGGGGGMGHNGGLFGAMGGDQGGGLDSFFPGFPPDPSRRTSQTPGQANNPFQPVHLGGSGQDLIGALMQMLAQEGNLPPGMTAGGSRGPAAMGDYVMSQQGFDQILEQLMHAAGPQGPLPATEAVIEGLPRIIFNEKTLEESVYKDCPVCKDDFGVGDEVMRIPCAHIFHPGCLQPWLKTNGSCPVCRFSLVPDEARDRSASGESGQGAGQASSTATQPGDAGDGQPQGQPMFANILNRLWGQSGAPSSAATENAPSASSAPAQASGFGFETGSSSPAPDTEEAHRPSTGPRSPHPQQGQPPPSTQSLSSGIEADDPAVPSLSSGIPDDYRERHRRREREREREQEQQSQRQRQRDQEREEERQYPSYFS